MASMIRGVAQSRAYCARSDAAALAFLANTVACAAARRACAAASRARSFALTGAWASSLLVVRDTTSSRIYPDTHTSPHQQAQPFGHECDVPAEPCKDARHGSNSDCDAADQYGSCGRQAPSRS